MAIPVLYWMLECKECGARRVVHDCYLVTGAGDDDTDLFGNYGGPPLEERYGCLKNCASGMRAIGSIFDLGSPTMWQYQPHVLIELDPSQIEEWWRLIREAGLETLP
jgi:hypothetical protein